VEAGLREGATLDARHDCLQRGRCRRWHHDVQTFTLLVEQLLAERLAPQRVELGPRVGLGRRVSVAVAISVTFFGRGVRVAVWAHRLVTATWIVELQQLGLQSQVRTTEAARVIGVALDLGRTAIAALHQHADAEAVARDRRRVERRDARLEALRPLVERQDLRLRLAAAGKAGERHGRGDHTEETAARNLVRCFGDALWELAGDDVLELGRVFQFTETAPVGGAVRFDSRRCRRGLHGVVHRRHVLRGDGRGQNCGHRNCGHRWHAEQ
jgi:hypothetical protein